MRYGSLFSGVGGFDMGLDAAGWECAWQVEVDPQARAVLRRHWPNAKLYEDVCNVGRPNLASVDLICGGFPCQDLSVAGRRGGLAGERSGLFYEFMRIVDELAPRWVLIENVPGLLSSNGGRDMGAVVGTLGELGYGWTYRVLDLQHFGAPQRRRRVFIVGRAGGYCPPPVLLEPEGLPGDPPTRTETRQSTTSRTVRRSVVSGRVAGEDGEGGAVGAALFAETGKGWWTEGEARLRAHPGGIAENIAVGTLAAHSARHGHAMTTQQAAESGQIIAHALRAEGFDASEACSVEGCVANPHAKGMCKSHYSRFLRHGDPLAGRVAEGEPLSFLLAHVAHDGDGCVAWPYAKLATGYGSVHHEGKTTRAHRLMCEMAHGPPPDDEADAAHSCGNRDCINPRHLRWATRAENMADTLEHGTAPRGERHGASRLTEGAVLEIRERLGRGETHDSIAAAFGVGRTTITDIAKGKNWAWLDGTGRGTPLVPQVFMPQSGGDCRGLDPQDVSASLHIGQTPAVAFTERGRKDGRSCEHQEGIAYSLNNPGKGSRSTNERLVAAHVIPRRLTPKECERLQGWPDSHTAWGVTEDGERKAMADGPRYRQCGNGVGAPVAEWIGRRILEVEERWQSDTAASTSQDAA